MYFHLKWQVFICILFSFIPIYFPFKFSFSCKSIIYLKKPIIWHYSGLWRPLFWNFSQKSLAIFTETSILDAWLSSEYFCFSRCVVRVNVDSKYFICTYCLIQKNFPGHEFHWRTYPGRDNSFRAYTKFSRKLTFFTPWYARIFDGNHDLEKSTALQAVSRDKIFGVSFCSYCISANTRAFSMQNVGVSVGSKMLIFLEILRTYSINDLVQLTTFPEITSRVLFSVTLEWWSWYMWIVISYKKRSCENFNVFHVQKDFLTVKRKSDEKVVKMWSL